MFNQAENESEGTVFVVGYFQSATENLSNDQTDYRFDWKLIDWKTDDLFAGVPFVGYAVRGQADLPKPADDLKATYSYEDGGTVTLTWTAPQNDYGRTGITHFVVYDDLHGGDHISQTSCKGAGVEHSVTINVKDYEATAQTFTVCSFYEQQIGSVSGIMVPPSNEVYCVFSMSGEEVNNLFDSLKQQMQGKIDTISAQLAELGTAPGENIKNLIDAYRSADALLKGQIEDVENAHAQLDAEMNEAIVLLQNSIAALNQELIQKLAQLQESNEESLQQAIADLSEAYNAADALIHSQLLTQSEEMNALEASTAEAGTALQEAIKAQGEAADSAIQKVQDDLEEVRNDLSSNKDSDYSAINNRIDTISSTLDAASQRADSALQENIYAQSVEIDELVSIHKKEVEAIRSELDQLRKDLEALQKTYTEHQEEINNNMQSHMSVLV